MAAELTEMTVDEKQKLELMFRAMGKDAIQARCSNCPEVETIFQIDEPLDDDFLANYLCAHCEDVL
jgi:hypothetical protein